MTNISTNDELFGRYLDGVADENDVAILCERLLADAEAADSLVAITRFETLIHSHLVDSNRSREVECLLEANAPPVPAEAFPVLSPLPSLSTIHHPLPTNFVGGPVFSYMVASVVLCLMLLGAWAYKITNVEMVVEDKPAINAIEDSGYKVVGRVSSMKDCVWPKDGLVTMVGASVPMGRKYVLSSGLLEITYSGGAKVILEGPCEYTADSRDGGFLRVGKLVARVEGRGERSAGQAALAASTKPQAAVPQPPAPSPQPLFAVHTPTAVVTDLGTEFGVEVDESGSTTSHVFRGSVSMQINGDGNQKAILLTADESARVEKNEGKDGDRTVSISKTDAFPKFARQLYEPLKLHDYAKMVLADRPLFYWTFDEPFGAAVEQVRGLSHQKLYPIGGAKRGDHAAIGSGLALGRAADFSGAAGVFASNRLRQARSMPGAWAIELWVQATGKRAENEGQYVVNAGIGARPPDYRDNPSVIFNWPHDADRNELQLFYPERGPTHDGPILADDDWHHVIFVFYGHEQSFGVVPRVDVTTDGRRRTIDRGEFGSMFSLEGQLCVGAAKIDLSHAFRGRIDELAFYDLSKMTIEQIEARIDDLSKRHFVAAHSDPATVDRAERDSSNISPSIPSKKWDKREFNNAVIKERKEQQSMGP